MPCVITFSLVSESLTGDIGDDWEYQVEARVFNPGITGAGTIRVSEHRLRPGTTQAPPGPSRAVAIPAGRCGSAPRIQLTVNATEVDWLIDDEGSNVVNVQTECPGPGGPPITVEREVSVGVRESPRLLGGSATFKVKARLVASCE